jgi:hypothetical protein
MLHKWKNCNTNVTEPEFCEIFFLERGIGWTCKIRHRYKIRVLMLYITLD